MLKRWGLHLCERGGKNSRKRALVAVARKVGGQISHRAAGKKMQGCCVRGNSATMATCLPGSSVFSVGFYVASREDRFPDRPLFR
jgi:hypothetical protein